MQVAYNTFQNLVREGPKAQPSSAPKAETKNAPPEHRSDSVSINEASSLESSRNRRVLGTIGAGLGAITGRIGLVLGSATAGAMAGGSVLGPVGAVIGGTVGLGAGAFVEFRDKTFKGMNLMGKQMPLGRMIGGTIGGIVGSAIGRVLDHLPFVKPKLGGENLNGESNDFSVKKLLKNVGNVNHTSMPTMNEAGKTQEIIDALKPGDVIVTNSDLWMDFEIPLKLTGARGDWTHTAVYDGKGKTIEALASRGVVERPVEELIGENHHVRILRPKYKDGGAEAAIDYARSKVGESYDFKFSETDDAFYCIELTHKALQHAAPEIDMPPNKLLWDKFGPNVVSPETFNKAAAKGDFEIIYDTGSNFNNNYLAKFS